MGKLKWVSVAWVFSCLVILSSCAVHTPTAIGVKSLEPDPRLVQGRLANGLTYLLLKNSTPENRVSMHLDVQAGSMNETDAERGVAHYLEHMLFNGSTHFKPDELIEYFQSIGMRFGADANAHTGFFETVYDVFLPSGDRASLDSGFLVLDDFAQGALLLESEVERERGVILAEKRERDSVSYRTFEATLDFELPGSRLPQRLPIGTDEVINNADHGLLKGYYDTWYRPENMVLVVVGDFNIAAVESLIKQRFSTMKSRAPQRLLPEDTWDGGTRDRAFYHYEPESGNTTVTIEKVRKVPFKMDTPTAFKKRAILDLAEAAVENRLSRLVRQKGVPFSDAGIYSGDFFQGVHFSAIAAESDTGEWQESLGLLETTLRSALEFGFSEQELARVKADFIQTLATEVKEAGTRKSGDLANEIINQVNHKRIFQSPGQRYDLLKDFVDALTVDDLVKTFREEWEKGPWLVLVTGNAAIESSVPQLAEDLILQAFQKSRAQKVSPPKVHEEIGFPYLSKPVTQGVIKAEKTVEPLDVKVVEFENQVRLSLKPTKFKKGEFLFKAGFGQGRKGEPETLAGIALLATSVVNESGFGGIDKDQLEAALAGRNVTVHLDADQGRFFITGSAGPEESELVFQLIRNYFLDPGFRPEALALAKDRYRQMYHEALGTPEGVMAFTGERFLAGGDSRFGLPLISDIEKITLADIQSWMVSCFSSSSLDVSVVGDFNPDQVLSQAATYLGTLPKRKDIDMEQSRPDPEFPAGKRLELTVDTTLEKALVQLAFPTDDFWDISKVRRLNVLAAIFSERLRQNVREKLGASYSPFAYNAPSQDHDGYGVFRAVVNVEPGATEMVLQEIQKLAHSLNENGVTQKEVELSLKPIITHIKDLQRNNEYWLESVLSGSGEHPEKLEWAKTILDDYQSIGVNPINLLAGEYLKTTKGASIIIRPLK
ncbi:peptidase M16 family protein [Desulforapulum autotrophicum HRM2]|uniref:Peptidase M16 family protein n=1 Tax=Desulforapulum autotrophicum (strain ATCC 43914 / DSM 3382 / VKM B-1955 / HRM2) TaxID=177437 RepID=C0QBW1_DESAH|nr:M16 family metallopeptidase [Desulforapulum autotrophicum]ACN14973.1 peptidase M16 family protein [Desulforapulum autotrophicum HRM2]